MSSSVCIDINDDNNYIDFQTLSNYFYKIDNNYIKTQMKQVSNFQLIESLCYAYKENHIIINYPYFKYITKNNIYSSDDIIQHLIIVMQNVLKEHNKFIIHLNTNNLNLIDVEKYYLFIQKTSQIMKDLFPEKMKTCYIYNAPYIFSKLFSIISVFIDKDTQKKIKIMDNN
jgi:hypothetical protein